MFTAVNHSPVFQIICHVSLSAVAESIKRRVWTRTKLEKKDYCYPTARVSLNIGSMRELTKTPTMVPIINNITGSAVLDSF